MAKYAKGMVQPDVLDVVTAPLSAELQEGDVLVKVGLAGAHQQHPKGAAGAPGSPTPHTPNTPTPPAPTSAPSTPSPRHTIP